MDIVENAMTKTVLNAMIILILVKSANRATACLSDFAFDVILRVLKPHEIDTMFDPISFTYL